MPMMVIDIITAWRQERQEEQRMTFAVMRKGELMSKLIDQQVVIDAVEAMVDKSGKGEIAGFYNAILKRVIDKLIALLSAQPEIVRCKDCKYWRKHKYVKETKRYMPFCGFNAIYTKSDDFCSRAERREE